MSRIIFISAFILHLTTGRSEYIPSTTSLDFVDAFGQCLKKGAELAFIPNRVQSKRFRKAIFTKYPLTRTRPFYFWVGIKRKDTTGEWGWTNQADNTKFKIAWEKGHPKVSGVGLDCGAISMKTRRIVSISCNNKMPYVCFKTNVEFKKE